LTVRLRYSIAALLALLLLSSEASVADETISANECSAPSFNMFALTPIDTIVVIPRYGPNAELLPHYPLQKASVTTHMPEPFFVAVKELFSNHPEITILPFTGGAGVPAPDVTQPNVLSLIFVLSARKEAIGNEPVIVGSVSVQLQKKTIEPVPSHGSPFAQPGLPLSVGMTEVLTTNVAPIAPITYPFIVPDNVEELQIRKSEAVNSLISYLPEYFSKVRPYKK
jgi:hypothetical protein